MNDEELPAGEEMRDDDAERRSDKGDEMHGGRFEEMFHTRFIDKAKN